MDNSYNVNTSLDSSHLDSSHIDSSHIDSSHIDSSYLDSSHIDSLNSEYNLINYLTDTEQKIVLFWVLFFIIQVTIIYVIYSDRFKTEWLPITLILYILYNIALFKMFSV